MIHENGMNYVVDALPQKTSCYTSIIFCCHHEYVISHMISNPLLREHSNATFGIYFRAILTKNFLAVVATNLFKVKQVDIIISKNQALQI